MLTAKAVENHLVSVVKKWGSPLDPGLAKLQESMSYSLLSQGKRFRPVLCLWTYRMLKGQLEPALPLASALEMIHCYSLIHDDLPSMDNDDLRRGVPTNHKVFGDGMALLAGNALLTDALQTVVDAYGEESVKALTVLKLLTKASGQMGMIGGQAIDIERSSLPWEAKRLQLLHSLKTGALIAVSVQVAGLLADVSDQQARDLKEYGETLGFAFQIADDLLDFIAESPETMNFATLLGPEKARELLVETSAVARKSLAEFGPLAQPLIDMIEFNLSRSK